MKKFLIIVLAVLMSLTACTNRTPIWILPPGVLYPDNEPEPEPCKHLELEATAWFDFDAEKHYPSAGKCKSCGESVTRTSIEIGTAKELATLGEDLSKFYDIGCYEISIIDDIDMSTEKEWPYIYLDGSKVPYNKKGFVINGNGHSIENLRINKESVDFTAEDAPSGIGFISQIWSDVTLEINELTLVKAKIIANKGSKLKPGLGGFVGYIDSSASVKFNDCHIINSTISGGHWAGGIYGWASGYDIVGDGPVLTTIDINNCSVENTTISSEDASVGGIIGHAGANLNTKVNVYGSSVTGCTIISEGGDNKIGNILGTNNQATTTMTGISCNDNTLNGIASDKIYGRLEGSGTLTIEGVEQTV